MRTRPPLWLAAAAVSVAAHGSAFAQRLGQAPSSDVHVAWWRVVSAFLLCIALALGGAFALKSRLGVRTSIFSTGERRLRLIEALRLSPKLDICLIRFDGHDYLIAATPNGATVLEKSSEPT